MHEPTFVTPDTSPDKTATAQATQPSQEAGQITETTCCIVGAGPAGAMLALLLARKGVRVTLLEAHTDFERDFRGDTLHPIVMENLDTLGLADRLLQLRHAELRTIAVQSDSGSLQVASFEGLKTKFPYVTVIAQSRFLEFLIEEARRYPHFQLVMGAQVDSLLEEDGIVRGVRYRGQDGWHDLRAVLTVAADGRFSRVRRLAGFEPVKSSPPMDVLWFRLSRKETDPAFGLGGRFARGAIFVLLNRFDYWQAGHVIPKGGYQALRTQGMEHLHQIFAQAVPELADRINEIQEWKQISVLSVESSYLRRWHRPGLLLIGDAAHVMSPVGGVGINYAIQDAIVAADVLAHTLQFGIVHERDLATIQRRRELPTRLIQQIQTFVQMRVFAPSFRSGAAFGIPPIVRFVLRLPFVRTIPAWLIGFGILPARIKN
jgi:2-polyprenyl-6-methoxyphenol hydroxylase-like FAD-dependent oxidoreductase